MPSQSDSVGRQTNGVAASQMLFIHGLLHGDWCWSEEWREFFRTRGIAVHTLNLRDSGGSGTGRKPLRWLSLSDYADAVVRAVACFNAPPIVVGHSLGALVIQMRLAQINPPAAILLAPTSPSAFRSAGWRYFRRHPARFLAVHLRRNPRLVIRTPEQCREWFFRPETPNELVHWCFAKLEDESFRVCLELLLGRTAIGRIRSRNPVLVLGAEQDGSVPRRAVEGVAARLGVRAEFFEGMGHDLMLEPGWQRVAMRMVCWLRELGLAPRPDQAAGPPVNGRPEREPRSVGRVPSQVTSAPEPVARAQLVRRGG